jgi:hypothetical protein
MSINNKANEVSDDSVRCAVCGKHKVVTAAAMKPLRAADEALEADLCKCRSVEMSLKDTSWIVRWNEGIPITTMGPFKCRREPKLPRTFSSEVRHDSEMELGLRSNDPTTRRSLTESRSTCSRGRG